MKSDVKCKERRKRHRGPPHSLQHAALFLLLAELCRQPPQAFSTPQPTAISQELRLQSPGQFGVNGNTPRERQESGATLPCISVPAVCHASRAEPHVRNPAAAGHRGRTVGAAGRALLEAPALPAGTTAGWGRLLARAPCLLPSSEVRGSPKAGTLSPMQPPPRLVCSLCSSE